MKHLYLQLGCIKQTKMKLVLQKSDTIGAFASILCMIHCFATPFLFIAQAHAVSSTAPTWWKWMDYLFLVISFFAVYRSAKTTSSNWMKYALWISWTALFAVIINEKMAFIHLPEFITYIVAATLVVLHLYNRKYCQCNNDKCCTT